MYKPKTKFKNISNTIKSVTLNDFSDGLTPADFGISDICHYGVAGRVISMAFDQVQSLLALGNDRGEVYVMGQKNVEVLLRVNKPEPLVHLKFVKNVFLVAIGVSSTLSVFSLQSKKLLTDRVLNGTVTIVESDPSLDYIYLGLDNGTVQIFDVVTGHMARQKISSLQRAQIIRKSWQSQKQQNSNMVPGQVDQSIKSLQLHPRDIGTILIAYAKSAVLYSIVEGKVKQEFVYEVPPGAPGGDLSNVETTRKPDLVKACFHPNGLNILTCHEDGSIVFWDTNNGRLIQARTIFDTDVDKPQSLLFHNPSGVQPMRYNKITQIEWICEKNPEITSLLIAGGDSIKVGTEYEQNLNLTKIEFDFTPKYSITSYEKMSQFYCNPKNLKIFPITQTSSIRRFLPLPRASPFFAGNHDPNIVLVLLQNGVIEVLKYPIGKLIYNASILPPSLSWVHPKLTSLHSDVFPRTQWMGLLSSIKAEKEKKPNPDFYDETILKGGAASVFKQRLFTEGRSVFATGHSDGSVKVWDASRFEMNDPSVIELDASFGLGSKTPSPIGKIAFSGHTNDLIVSTYDGDVILYKYGNNRWFNPSISQEDYDKDFSLTAKMQNLTMRNGLVVNVEKNVPAYVHRGFLPIIAIKPPGARLQVTALQTSHIEFSAIAYSDGQFILVDRRVSDIILLDNINKYYSSKRKRPDALSYVTSIEFAIMKGTEDAKYTSILLLLGTSSGGLVTFQIFPGSSPNSKSRFQTNYLSCVEADHDKIRDIIPINAGTGDTAVARTSEFAQLGSGVLIKGLIVTISSYGIRVFKSPTHKSANINFDQNSEILSANISRVRSINPDAPMETTVLVVLFANSEIKILALPSLTEIKSMRLAYPLNKNYAKQSAVLLNGDVVIRIDEHEGMLVHVTSYGKRQGQFNEDVLYNHEAKIPVRPVFNSLQWARGSKVTTMKDLELLYHGDRQPRSKYPKETELANNSQSTTVFAQALGAGKEPVSEPYGKDNYGSSSNVSPSPYTTKQPKTNNAGWGFNVGNLQSSFNSTMSSLETKFNDVGEAVSESVNGTVEETKNSMMKSFVKSKFSF